MQVRWSGALLCAHLLAATASAQPLKICIGRLDTAGLEPRETESIRAGLERHLVALGAEVLAAPDAGSVEQECLARPACVQQTVADLGADGLLAISVLRVGLEAELDLRAYDSQGRAVHTATATVPAQEVLTSSALRTGLQSALVAIGPAAAVRTGVASTPVPEPPSLPGQEPAPPGATTSPSAQQVPEPPPVEVEPRAASGALPIAGAGALGAGALLMVVSLVPGVLAIDLDARLQSGCEEGRCPPALHDEVDRLGVYAWSATALQTAAALLAAAGAVLLVVVAGDRQPAAVEP